MVVSDYTQPEIQTKKQSKLPFKTKTIQSQLCFQDSFSPFSYIGKMGSGWGPKDSGQGYSHRKM